MGVNIDARAINLKNDLAKVEKRIRDIVRLADSTNNPTNLFWNKIQRDLRVEFEKLRIITLRWSTKNIPAVYLRTMQEQIKRIKAIKFRPPVRDSFNIIKKRNVNRTAISTLLKDFNNSWLLTIDQSEKFMLRTFNMTQNILIEEKVIDKAIEKGFFRTGSTYGPKKGLQKEFMDKLKEDKYITVIDKNGKPIHYQINTYSEMVARTKLREAQTIAVVNTGAAFGTDLIQVSSHNTATPFDAQFEGKIFSISGNDPDFPKAGFLPPFHPNCWHTISVVFRETLERRGINRYIDFAKGKTGIHPTRESFIPVADRFTKKGNFTKKFSEHLIKAHGQKGAVKKWGKKLILKG
jgi:hypothetical protein